MHSSEGFSVNHLQKKKKNVRISVISTAEFIDCRHGNSCILLLLCASNIKHHSFFYKCPLQEINKKTEKKTPMQ